MSGPTAVAMLTPAAVPAQPARAPRRWSMALRIALSLALLGGLLAVVDVRSAVRAFGGLHAGLAALLCVLGLSERVLMAVKWNLLLRSGGVRISHAQAVRLYLAGHTLGTLTPGALGGDAYRVAALAGLGRTHLVLSTVILERVFGIVVVAGMALAALPFSARYLGANSRSVSVAVVVAFAVSALVLAASLKRPGVRADPQSAAGPLNWSARLAQLREAYADFRSRPGTLVLFAALTVGKTLLLITINYLAARALGIRVSFGYFLCVMPLLHLLIRLPVHFHGIGLQEGLFAYFLQRVGYGSAEGLAVSVLLRAVELFAILLPGLAIMLRPGPTAQRINCGGS